MGTSAPSNAPSDSDATSPCVDRLCELAGRDRAVATKLRQQAATLLKLAEALEINATIGDNATADLLLEQG